MQKKDLKHILINSLGSTSKIVIATALACEPKILIADEPTTALDVTMQAQILDLMKELQQKLKHLLFLLHMT